MLLLLLLLLTGCGGTKFYLFGVDTDIITEAEGKELVYAGIGAVASLGSHVVGHYVAGEVFGVDFEYQDYYTKEHVTIHDDTSDSDLRWFARGGFVMQQTIGTALTSFEATRYSYFTKGYVGMNAVHTWTYGLRRSKYHDLEMLDDHGGNGNMEWGIYSAISLHNVLRTNWTRKGGDNN